MFHCLLEIRDSVHAVGMHTVYFCLLTLESISVFIFFFFITGNNTTLRNRCDVFYPAYHVRLDKGL